MRIRQWKKTRRTVGRGAMLLTLLLVLAGAAAPAGLALEPPRQGELARLQRQGRLDEALGFAKALGNHKMSPALLENARMSAGRAVLGLTAPAPPLARRGMPTTGAVKVLALLIDFEDYRHSNDASTIAAKLFGGGVDAGHYPYESLHDFYQRSSYDQLDIQGSVLGWYRTAHERSSVVQTDGGREALIEEALTYYEGQGHDFSQYDNNGDGTVDYLIVIWAGPQGSWSSFWWGYQTYFEDSAYALDGKTLETYSWQWESWYQGSTTSGFYDPLVVIHETGHALGLPDYYDYDETVGPDGGVGELDMMDGTWGDHNAFSKWTLGWIAPQVVTGAPRAVTLAASGTNADALVVMPDATAADPFREYFVVQNRHRVGNDSDCADHPAQNLPGDGLLVWHIDARLFMGLDYRYDNSWTEHKLLRLMEADGREEIETVAGYHAMRDDYYLQGATLSDTSTPDSKRYDGTASTVSVADVPEAADSMTFTAGVGVIPRDETAPVTSVTGAVDGGYVSHDVTLAVTGVDEDGGSGVAGIVYELDDGGEQTVAGPVAQVVVRAVPNGPHAIVYHAVDVAGNAGDSRVFTLTGDTAGPVGSGRSTTARKGRTVRLRYEFGDVLSPWVRDIKITVRSRTGRLVWSRSLGAANRQVDLPLAFRWRPRARGVFRYQVTCRDAAGNAQAKKATGRITVR
jgi:M6 family metalloprotease-like protein